MEFAETRLASPNPTSPSFAEHLSSAPIIADAFSIVLDSTLSQIHQELPDSSSNVKNDFLIKAESSTFATNSISKSEKSQSQTQNLIQLMDQLDPMLSWDLLAQKILSKYSIFEDIIERTKAKPCQNNNDPIQFFQLLLCQVDELLGQLKQMIQECCYAKTEEEHFSTSSQDYLQLSNSQSMYLFGSNCMTLNLKNLNEFPEKYKVKIFHQSTGDNNDNTNDEDSNLIMEENNKEDNERKPSKNNKKKRSRQKFSQCDKCYKSWNDVRSYELHLKEPGKCPGKPWFKLLPGKKYSCIHPMCGGVYLEFQDQSNYWNHVRERHWVEEDLVVNCPHCREKFPLLEMMKYHVKISHPKTKMCRFCGSVFATKNDLAKHERTHTGEKPFACDKCTFRTSTAGTLRGHIKRRHEDPNLHRTFVCNQCEKGFFSAFDLKQHILTHSDIKRYTCPACGKQLKNDSCYRRHMMCVHGQKFSCDICNKDFSAPMGLSIHRRDVHGIVC